MKKLISIFSVLFTILLNTVFAQNANVSYEVQISAANGVHSSAGSWSSGASCWETGNQEYTASLRVDGPTAGPQVCVTCDNSGDCDYGHGTLLRSSTNVTASIFIVYYDMFEDDAGDRCTADGSDDCRGYGSFVVNFSDAYAPTAPNSYNNYTDNQVYNGGSSEHRVRLDNSWRYAGNMSALTPTCTQQGTTYAAGQVRSWSVNLTIGVTYVFNNCGNVEDTYLRLYGSDGYTLKASADQGCSGMNSSSLTCTPTTSGMYYLELSHASRSTLVSNGVLYYYMASPEAVTVTGSGTQCGGTVTLNATGGAGGNIYWQGTTSGGTSTATPSNSQGVTTTGTYYFRPMSTGGCWGTEGSATVIINAIPSAPTGNTSQSFCNSATINDLSAAGSNVQWYANASGGSPLAGTTSLLNGYHYFASQNVFGCESTNRLDVLVTINTTSIPTVSLGVDQNNICAGIQVNFTATPTNGGTPVYQWFLNGSAIGNNQPSYSYTPANGDNLYVVMTSDAPCISSSFATSNTVNMVVHPMLNAGISAAASHDTLCQGTQVTLTASPVNGGVPAYQWYLNNSPVGTSSNVYSYTPANGDQVYVSMTSSVPCVIGSPVSSGVIALTTLPVITPSLTLSESQNNICAGTQVTFTTTAANGGTTPTYQWFLNGTPFANNFPTYSYIPANGDNLYAVLTSNAACVTSNTATSNSVSMAVQPVLNAGVSFATSQTNVCQGTQVTCTATPSNGGTPTYQWFLNNAPVGSNSDVYSFIPSNGDQVYVSMTSNVPCITGSPVSSGVTSFSTHPVTTATVAASENLNNICYGTWVTFTATPVNGGTTPAYQWYVNGVVAGTNQPTYSYAPASGDLVYVIMTSSDVCANGSPDTSNSILMKVSAASQVTANAVVSQNNICQGTQVTFTASETNGGTPQYQWYLNGLMVGSNQPTYSFTPVNGDMVYVTVTSSLSCIVGSPASSAVTIMNVSPCTGISNASEIEHAIMIYPNPAEDLLMVNFEKVNRMPVSMKLLNAAGQVVFETSQPIVSNNTGINVHNLSPGSYVLQIEFDNVVVKRSVIIK